MSQHSTEISDTTFGAYRAAKSTSALLERSDRGRIVVSGKDRTSFLHGLLTNDITRLAAGQGCYAAYLTPQGRMITDLWVYELGDQVLLTLARDLTQKFRARLDDLIFSEDVQIEDRTETLDSVAVIGPDSAQRVADALETTTAAALNDLPSADNLVVDLRGHRAIVMRIDDAGVPGFELVVDRNEMADLRASLVGTSIPVLDRTAREALRIEAGIPKFLVDMDEDTIPLEAGIESDAISFTKGCYVGQEVIIRVLHRGHGRIARKLVGLIIDGEETPSRGDAVKAEGSEAGSVTSAVWSPALNRPIALAMVKRDYFTPGTLVHVNGLAAEVRERSDITPA